MLIYFLDELQKSKKKHTALQNLTEWIWFKKHANHSRAKRQKQNWNLLFLDFAKTINILEAWRSLCASLPWASGRRRHWTLWSGQEWRWRRGRTPSPRGQSGFAPAPWIQCPTPAEEGAKSPLISLTVTHCIYFMEPFVLFFATVSSVVFVFFLLSSVNGN